jgi:hypothetical protein
MEDVKLECIVNNIVSRHPVTRFSITFFIIQSFV